MSGRTVAELRESRLLFCYLYESRAWFILNYESRKPLFWLTCYKTWPEITLLWHTWEEAWLINLHLRDSHRTSHTYDIHGNGTKLDYKAALAWLTYLSLSVTWQPPLPAWLCNKSDFSWSTPQDAGVKIIAVGVGRLIDTKELDVIALENKGNVFHTSNFSQLLSRITDIVKSFCKAKSLFSEVN